MSSKSLVPPGALGRGQGRAAGGVTKLQQWLPRGCFREDMAHELPCCPKACPPAAGCLGRTRHPSSLGATTGLRFCYVVALQSCLGFKFTLYQQGSWAAQGRIGPDHSPNPLGRQPRVAKVGVLEPEVRS